MLDTFKTLILALLNATLILVALCLFLAWKVTDKADQITASFASNLVSVQPLRDDIQGATAELAALRQDLAQVSAQSGELRSASLQHMQARVDEMQSKMDSALTGVSNLSQMPTQLVDHAIDAGADRLGQVLKGVRGCVPPES